MGGGNWSDVAYSSLTSAKSYSTKTRAEIFTSTKTTNDMSPKGIDIRESRDSDEHPESLAVMVFLDVTGSMGHIPEHMIKDNLGPLMSTLIKHGIDHPQVLFGAIGDHITDTAPLQVGQFEVDTALLDKWLTDIYLEGCGGGQWRESYALAWLFGARHTSIDCFEKRSQKGFLFTIGDEGTWEDFSADSLKEIMGYAQGEDVNAVQLLEEVEKMYHVFHIHINETSYKDAPAVLDSWRDLIGERLLILDDHESTAELIASTVAMIRGVELDLITKDFDSKTKNSVTTALATIRNSDLITSNETAGIVEL